MGIEFKVIKTAPLDDMTVLYRQAGWIKEAEIVPDEVLYKIVSQSFCFMGAFDGAKMVGMARALSDGVSDAYIQDVTILPSYRAQGLGRQIINALIDQLTRHGIGWIGLIAEPDTSSFYTALGFKPMERYIPMLLRRS